MKRRKWLSILMAFVIALSLVGIMPPPEAHAGVAYEDILVQPGDPWSPVALTAGETLGQSFIAPRDFNIVLLSTPTWNRSDSGFTFTLRSGGPDGEVVFTQKLHAVDGQTSVELPDVQSAGNYYAEMSEPVNQIGWWTKTDIYADGSAYADGQPVADADRAIILRYSDGSSDGGGSLPFGAVYEDAYVPSGSQTPVKLEANQTIGQDFLATREFNQITIPAPTWTTSNSGFTFTLYKDGPTGQPVYTQDIVNATDNHTDLFIPKQPAGRYYAEMSKPVNSIGWWTRTEDVYAGGTAFENGQMVPDVDRSIVVRLVDQEVTAEQPPFELTKCTDANTLSTGAAPSTASITASEPAAYDVSADMSADASAETSVAEDDADTAGDGSVGSDAGRKVKPPTHYEAVHMVADRSTSTYALTNGPAFVERRIVPPGQAGTAETVKSGTTLGQEFVANDTFVGIKLETALEAGATAHMEIRKDGPTGAIVYCGTIDSSLSGGSIAVPSQPSGRYYVELSDPQGAVNWSTYGDVYEAGTAYTNGAVTLTADRGVTTVHEVANTIGQTFKADDKFNQLIVPMKDFQADHVKVQLYYQGTDQRADHILLVNAKLEKLDNKWAYARVGDSPAGHYYVEFSNNGAEPVSFQLADDAYADGEAHLYGEPWNGHDLVLGYARSDEPMQVWDTGSSNWVAVDDLGRVASGNAQSHNQSTDKFVGIFYHTWHGQHGTGGPYDISKILAQDPDALTKPDSPLWGPMYAPHHWGESVFGYYLSDDDYVIRKHAQMLSDIGVDAIIFDTSNQFSYKNIYMNLLRVYREIRLEGGQTPQVIFLTPFWDSGKVTSEVYQDLYGAGLFEDLWFKWDGKPIILANPDTIGDTYKQFFTVRRPQPSYFVGPETANSWGWLEVYPQHGFYDADGNIEEVTVGVAQNSVNGRLSTFTEQGATGRSYHDGQEPSPPYPTGQGLNFQEQWNRAFELNPEFVFVTGWNEWVAGRFPSFNGVSLPVMFVDQFTEEFSRDIEPMVGGHGDNYYYQLAENIAKFKGTPSAPQQPAANPKTVVMNGKFDDWRGVKSQYKDDIGDTMHRNNKGYGDLVYVNTTGRNDFVEQRVSHDKDHVYFYAKTKDAITSYTDPHWMQLFLNTDGDYKTGWYGYDYVVSDSVVDENTTTLKRLNADGTLTFVANISYRVVGNELELAIPKAALGLAQKEGFQLDFKWADNIQKYAITEFTVNGDAAPNNRFNYRYSAK